MKKYIVNKNKILQQEIDAKYAQEYMTDSDKRWVENLKSQIKDESIFEQFDFLTSSPNGEDDNWGEVIGFTVEEMFDMPTASEAQTGIDSTACEKQDVSCRNETNSISSHELFCVTEKDLDFIDIDDLF